MTDVWFPDVARDIAELEALIVDRTDIKEHAKTWGWGGDPTVLKASRVKKSKTGRLCSSCDARHDGGQSVTV